MPRIRTIKPELPQSESMGNISREARLCFILLFTISDDFGKLRGNSRMLASLLYPYDNDAPKLIDKWLDELAAQGCVIRYCIDGTHYMRIENWSSHQKVDRPTKSKIPDPREDSRELPEASRGLVVGSKDQGPRIKDQGISKRERKPQIALSELSVDHVRDWLSKKRTEGKYLHHDEHFILEYFRNYCQSKGKTYNDYPAALRNAFEWTSCQPKGANAGGTSGKHEGVYRGTTSQSPEPAKSKLIAEGERLAAMYRQQADDEDRARETLQPAW